MRPKEEHDGAGIVELVHLVEVGHLCDVDEVDHDKVFAFFRNGVESLVHFHTCWVPVMTKPNRRWLQFSEEYNCNELQDQPDENNPVLLREDGLVHLPPIVEVLQHETHPEALFLLSAMRLSFDSKIDCLTINMQSVLGSTSLLGEFSSHHWSICLSNCPYWRPSAYFQKP